MDATEPGTQQRAARPDDLARAAAKKAGGILEGFKAFAFRGNVVDLAVGVIIGAAFGKIVDSLVRNILMPTLGVILPGRQGYVGWKLVVGEKEVPYGLFLGDVANFLIVSVALYLFIVQFLGLLTRNKADAPSAPTRDQELLAEIRDLLKSARPGHASPESVTHPQTHPDRNP